MHMKKRLFQSGFVAAAALSLGGCGVEFDTLGQVEGVRVLGVQADPPIARPGETVDFRMVVHDTGDIAGRPRELSYLWIGGCDNPQGSYASCFARFGALAKNFEGLQKDPSELTADELAEIAEALSESGISIGFGDTFRVNVDEDIIRNKPPSSVPLPVPYAVTYTLFAACAGELRLDPDSEAFPIGCFDGDERLGARDFVIGYTSTYVYEEQRNSIPRIDGVRIGGKDVPESLICIDAECERAEPDPKRKCSSRAPKIKACKSGTQRQSCPKVEVSVRVDPDSVDQDAPISLGGETATESVWVNYHTDNGSFSTDVALVSSIDVGFRENPKTEFYAPENRGPAWIWAVVRDSRAGFTWARTEICVE
jgi:hypothetical protein